MPGREVDALADLHGLGPNIVSHDADIALFGRKQVGQDGKEGGLASPVGPQKAPEATYRYVETYPPEGLLPSSSEPPGYECLFQSLHLNGIFQRQAPPLLGLWYGS